MRTLPDPYLVGCDPYIPRLEANAAPQVNAGRLATAFKKCSNLQKDQTAWTVAYLRDLSGAQAK